MAIKYQHKYFKGFTLIEVMLVIVVIGIMVAAIQINFNSNKPEAELQNESARFASKRQIKCVKVLVYDVFNLAAEYGLLNNIELGLYTEKNSYQFVGFDGVRWTPLLDNDLLAAYQLPETMKMTFIFDDLPLELPTLIDAELFTPDDERIEQMEADLAEDEKNIIPQVYILSGGDITPFRVEFSLISQHDNLTEITYAVTGLYSTPVELVGPIVDGVYPTSEKDEND